MARRSKAEAALAERLAHIPPAALCVTLADACAMIGVGRSTIYEAIAAGEIEAVKHGARTLVPVASLRDFVARLPRVVATKAKAAPADISAL